MSFEKGQMVAFRIQMKSLGFIIMFFACSERNECLDFASNVTAKLGLYQNEILTLPKDIHDWISILQFGGCLHFASEHWGTWASLTPTADPSWIETPVAGCCQVLA